MAYTATTDKNGKYTIPVDYPGDYDVSVDHDYYDAEIREVTVGLNETAVEDFELNATESGYAVSGTVTDDGGVALEAADVWAVDATTGDTAKRTTTDANGDYSLELPSGDYDLKATADGYFTETRTISVAGSRTEDFSLSVAVYADEVLADNPIAYWRLGEASGSTTAVDETANGHDGTYNGPTLEVEGAISDGDTAASFDGTDDYVALDHSYATQGVLAALTVEAWVKTSDAGPGQIVGYDRNEYFRLSFNDVDTVGIGFHTTESGGTIHDFHGSDVADGEWHHVVGVYDGTDKIIYIDGQENARASNPHGGAALGTGTTRYAFLGDDSEADTFDGSRNDEHFNGVIDEPAVYEHALSATRVQTHYDAA